MHYLMNCNWRPYLINESDNDNNNKQSKQMTKQTEYLGRPQKREIQKMELKIYTYIYIYMLCCTDMDTGIQQFLKNKDMTQQLNN